MKPLPISQSDGQRNVFEGRVEFNRYVRHLKLEEWSFMKESARGTKKYPEEFRREAVELRRSLTMGESRLLVFAEWEPGYLGVVGG